MTIIDIIALAGGLALLLYGMHVMGNGLEKMSGGRMEQILERLTSNRFLGFALGILVTMVIQSSAATVIMVIGFVNSGIMKLAQSVAVVMGANIGTTITAWILSLTGLESENVWLSLVKPASLAPMAALIGAVLYLFMKRRKHKDLGSILLGFALLMYGMVLMSDAVAPLKDAPWFSEMVTLFSNPFLGVLVGLLMTALLQSSSASVGILQAMAASGLVSLWAAVPIICGQNIGSCLTPLLSISGSTRDSKRVAAIHLIYNIFGTVAFLALFYALRSTLFPVDNTVSPVEIAIIHTAFKVLASLLLFPFTNLLVKVSGMFVRESNKDTELAMLDERLLSTPAIAVEHCHGLTNRMARMTGDTLLTAVSLLSEYDTKGVELVIANEDNADRYEDRLGDYLVQLSGHELTEHDTKTVSMLLSAIGDFERICDHALNLQEAATEMQDKHIEFSADAKAELAVMTDAVTQITAAALKAFLDQDPNMASLVEPLEEVVDDLRDELKARHIARLQQGLCTIELGFVLSDILTNCERISDHCSNIAVAVLADVDGDVFTHSYLAEVKHTSEAFAKEYDRQHEKYFARLSAFAD